MRLLLDAHVSPTIERALQQDSVDAVAVRDWLDGSYRSAPDDQLLSTALTDRRVLVTYDCRTIPPLLKEWAETGRHHAGVILVDEKTLRPDDIGGLLRAVRALLVQSEGQDWHGRVVFLQRG